MHFDRETMDRVLHQELRPRELEGAQEHVESCPGCQDLYHELRREVQEIDGLLSLIDSPATSVSPDAMIARAERHTTGWQRWAAGVVISLAMAGVAYAAPSSPLPGVLEAFTSRAGPPTATVTTPEVLPVDDDVLPADDLVSGIIVPSADGLVIVFSAAGPTDVAIVTLGNGSAIRVEVTNGTASFDSDIDRLMISPNAGPNEYRISVPLDAARTELRVAGRALWVKEGQTLVTDAKPLGAGSWAVRLGR